MEPTQELTAILTGATLTIAELPTSQSEKFRLAQRAAESIYHTFTIKHPDLAIRANRMISSWVMDHA